MTFLTTNSHSSLFTSYILQYKHRLQRSSVPSYIPKRSCSCSPPTPTPTTSIPSSPFYPPVMQALCHPSMHTPCLPVSIPPSLPPTITITPTNKQKKTHSPASQQTNQAPAAQFTILQRKKKPLYLVQHATNSHSLPTNLPLISTHAHTHTPTCNQWLCSDDAESQSIG